MRCSCRGCTPDRHRNWHRANRPQSISGRNSRRFSLANGWPSAYHLCERDRLIAMTSEITPRSFDVRRSRSDLTRPNRLSTSTTPCPLFPPTLPSPHISTQARTCAIRFVCRLSPPSFPTAMRQTKSGACIQKHGFHTAVSLMLTASQLFPSSSQAASDCLIPAFGVLDVTPGLLSSEH